MKFCAMKLVLIAVSFAAGTLGLCTNTAEAQALPQITQEVSNAELTTLKGNVHPLAQSKYDQGTVPDSTATGRLMLTLKRPAAQENALRQFLAEAHSKGSSNFHKWLTPAEFGKKYGPADADLAVVQAWLQSEGFTINKIGVGKTAIEFSGTAGQIKSAFHTELHTYKVNGEVHHANATNPQIPAALNQAIAGVGALNDFYPKSQMQKLGKATYNLTSHKIAPQWTVPADLNGDVYFAMGPKDFATQYNLMPLYTAGTTGTGQTIGIINNSNIDLGLVSAYRKLYGVDGTSATPNLPHVIIDGDDPGINGDSGEAYLDVELSGAIAPQATVNLYIAADTDYTDGLDLAILRAVEDDAATVLSLSFGGCEAALGASGMAYYNAVWEQAAAQGQTVVVSSGDSGAAGCDQAGSSYAEDGLQVNGIASTSWNIAVGGTDFYYSDYATGATSASNYWNTTNDINLGSLKSPIPEQPWNNSQYGLNAGSAGAPVVTGTGGGQSTCALIGGPLAGTNALTSYGYCAGLGGFPKPEWQAGPGVPKDQVRDLPDISLFAANGLNYSFYAICIDPGDCVNTDPGTGAITYYGVGGTSASTPAFAGIMALVNQKYGAQGQANYVLYPLAAKIPTVFHDVTVGSNNQPCDGLQCSADATGGGASLQNWYATPGYDLASGLGSVDANALVANWNSVSFGSTTTTFSASPASVTHGQSLTLTATVAADSGSTTPTGSVALIADTTLPADKGQLAIPLGSNGTGTANVNFLPGGTYNLYGRYGGDGTYASSQSTPLSVTVNPETSILNYTMINAYSNYSTGTIAGTNITNGDIFPYGSVQVRVDLQPIGVNAPVDGTDGIATGTTSVLDNGVVISTNPLNSDGESYYSSGVLAPGNHSFTFSYSGDPSFNPSAITTPITFTIQRGTTSLSAIANATTISSGGSLVVQASVAGNSDGLPLPGLAPTGNITITLGSQTQTVPLVPYFPPNPYVSGMVTQATATASFTNLSAGIYTLSGAYGGDANWAPATSSNGSITVTGPSTLLNSTTSVAISSPANADSIQPGTLVTLTATVAGGSGATVAPTGQVQFVSDGFLFGPNAGAIQLIPGTGTNSTAAFTFTAYESLPGANQFYAIYSGDGVYNTSTSGQLQFNNDVGDFSILNNTPTITVASGSPVSASLTLSSINEFSGSVTLSCAVTGSGTPVPLCTIPATVAVPATGQATATVQFTTSIPAATTSQLGTHSHGGLWVAGGGTVFACVFLLGIPKRRRKWQTMLALLLFMGLSGAIVGCGGGVSKQTSNPPPPQQQPTLVPAGAYTAVITGTNGTTTHNIAVTIVVR